MTGFTARQLKKLATPLDPTHVQSRIQDGRSLSYVEGWFVLAEANRIFGYDGWDREMVHFERVFERRESQRFSCAYLARVRVRVRANASIILREGTGFGQATDPVAADAHERALKAAETDATKRALATFGSRFGLLLYDRHARETSKGDPSRTDKDDLSRPDHEAAFRLIDADGRPSLVRSAEAFCGGLRQLIAVARDTAELERLKRHNALGLERLRLIPELVSGQGRHYADILEQLMVRKAAGWAAGRVSAGTNDVVCDSAVAEAQETDPLQKPGQREASSEITLPSDPDPDASNPSEASAVSEGSRESVIAAEEMASSSDETSFEVAESEPAQEPAIAGVARPASISADVLAGPPLPKPGEVDLYDRPVRRVLASNYVPVPPYPLAALRDRLTEAVVVEAVDPALENAAAAAGSVSIIAPPTRRSHLTGGPTIDKSQLILPTERRLRSKLHLVFVASKPCLICEELPCHAHHLTFAQPRGLSLKVSDEFTVPLCAVHHNELHRAGNETVWWRHHGIEPLKIAQGLWAETWRTMNDGSAR